MLINNLQIKPYNISIEINHKNIDQIETCKKTSHRIISIKVNHILIDHSFLSDWITEQLFTTIHHHCYLVGRPSCCVWMLSACLNPSLLLSELASSEKYRVIKVIQSTSQSWNNVFPT